MLDYLELIIKKCCEGQSPASIHIYQGIVPKPSVRMIRSLLHPTTPRKLRTGALLLEINYGGALVWPYICGLTFTDQGHPISYFIPPILYSYTQRYLKDIARLMRDEGVNPSDTWLAQGLKEFVKKEERGEHVDLDDYGEIPAAIAIITRRSSAGLYSTREARKLANEI